MAERYYTNPGTPFRKVRSLKVNEDGSETVVTTGRENFQEYIDSFRSSTEIANIVARFNAGDTSVLNVSTPLYGDFTAMPKTYAEFLQKKIDGEKFFMSLAPEIREKFGNDFNKFFHESTSPEFLEKIGFVVDKAVEVVDGSVSSDVIPIEKPAKEVIA